jgi:hypothetical protein
MKNSIVTIGNGTRDLPSSNAVPQPTALPRTPIKTYDHYFNWQLWVIYCGLVYRINPLASEFFLILAHLYVNCE